MGLSCDIGGPGADEEAQRATELYNNAVSGDQSAWQSLARLEERVNGTPNCGSAKSFAEIVYNELNDLPGAEVLRGLTKLNSEDGFLPQIDFPEKKLP
ncbi:MAG: hypothetical protein IT343_02770 [Candidatus Melainabacteria bacterium]|jgi:hypothetical protein|nr:hypothetical protein [Candidatus Melainabacteria bacterium]